MLAVRAGPLPSLIAKRPLRPTVAGRLDGRHRAGDARRRGHRDRHTGDRPPAGEYELAADRDRAPVLHAHAPALADLRAEAPRRDARDPEAGGRAGQLVAGVVAHRDADVGLARLAAVEPRAELAARYRVESGR